MNEKSGTLDSTPTLTFEDFWPWLITHPNCVLRAGSRHAVIFDDDDYHWHFAQEDGGTHIVQVLRGKRLVGELVIRREGVAYVQGVLGDQENEFVFELISGDEREQNIAFFFVLTHGFDAQDLADGSSRVH